MFPIIALITALLPILEQVIGALLEARERDVRPSESDIVRLRKLSLKLQNDLTKFNLLKQIGREPTPKEWAMHDMEFEGLCNDLLGVVPGLLDLTPEPEPPRKMTPSRRP